jgi:hypothetical protein
MSDLSSRDNSENLAEIGVTEALEGRAALVTEGGSGVGANIARGIGNWTQPLALVNLLTEGTLIAAAAVANVQARARVGTRS